MVVDWEEGGAETRAAIVGNVTWRVERDGQETQNYFAYASKVVEFKSAFRILDASACPKVVHQATCGG